MGVDSWVSGLVLGFGANGSQLAPGSIEGVAYSRLKVTIGAIADRQFFSLHLEVNS